MYLKSIELSGFKSFAKKSTLEFSSSISAIVGPNGSGKSNVAEAFRFVLGEQSIKSMRGKKGEDLIWNGGGGEARAGRASVRLVFDNADKTFDIDFPEVSIERAVHRDGANEYFINGSRVRLRDVLELLAAAKIGASGHHIISQGEADKILNANPKDRKVFVEDALGLRLYQYKRQESERKLESTFENISQVQALRKEVAPHLRFLGRQVEKIEKAESLRSELIALAKEYFKREDDYISAVKREIKDSREPLAKQRERLEKELASARALLEEAGKRENKDYAILALESEISAARSRRDALVRELGKIEGLMSAEEKALSREKERARSNEHKSVSISALEDFARSLEAVQEANEMRRLFAEFIKSKKEILDTASIQSMEKSLSALGGEKSRLEKEISAALLEERDLDTKYQTLKAEMERAKDSGRDAEKAVFRIMSEENELLSRLRLLEAREERVALEDAEFKRELEEVAHLVGAEVLEYRSLGELLPKVEDRSKQDERKRQMQKMKVRLEDAGLAGAEEMLKEYKETKERDEFLARELEDLEKSAESLRSLIAELETRLAKEFSEGIEKINKSFGEYFQTMFGGGNAKLALVKEKKIRGPEELEDVSLDEPEVKTEEGLDISVSLPRKSIRSLMMLSGGERALTSIALIFAISQVNPPPFIILDETDAALDEANSKKYGDMVETLSRKSQLILITHNRETMSRAGVIYGVTMSSTGVSKLLSIAFEEAVAVAK